MIAASIYRLALYVLPAELRIKHGTSMETLYLRELSRAREQGAVHVAVTFAGCISDVMLRGVYELHRSVRSAIAPSETTSSNVSESSRLLPSVLHSPTEKYPMNDSHTQLPTSRQLLLRLSVTFTVALTVLTSMMLYVFSSRQLSRMTSTGSTAELLWLALPFTLAMTIPMAVFVAVTIVFARLKQNGSLGAATRQPGGVRSLATPVLWAAAAVSLCAFVVTAEIVPRSNARLQNVMAGREVEPGDRSMTITQLRAAAQKVGPALDANAQATVAGFEIEVQKKIALPAASLVLALAAIGIAFVIPRGSMVLSGIAGIAVFGAYYSLIMMGETLADELIVSPFVGMWWANALMLAVASLFLWLKARPNSGVRNPVLAD